MSDTILYIQGVFGIILMIVIPLGLYKILMIGDKHVFKVVSEEIKIRVERNTSRYNNLPDIGKIREDKRTVKISFVLSILLYLVITGIMAAMFPILSFIPIIALFRLVMNAVRQRRECLEEIDKRECEVLGPKNQLGC